MVAEVLKYIGIIVTPLLAILAATWRMSSRLTMQDTQIASILQRIERIERMIDTRLGNLGRRNRV